METGHEEKDYVNTKHCLQQTRTTKNLLRKTQFFPPNPRDKSGIKLRDSIIARVLYLRTFSVSWFQSIIYLSEILIPRHVNINHSSSIEHFYLVQKSDSFLRDIPVECK